MPSVTIGGVVYELPPDDSQAQKVPQYNAIIQALAGMESGTGTSFPTSPAPATNDRFFRTDRSIEYFYNGTRWLSTKLFNDILPTVSGALPYAATINGPERAVVPYPATYDLWLVDFQLAFFIVGGTALGASHKWVVTLRKLTTGVDTIIATVNIDSGASSTWRTSTVAIGALLGTTHLSFLTDYVKTGTPGNIHSLPRVSYRLVG